MFHEDQTCEEYQAAGRRNINQDEQKPLRAVERISRPCPGPGRGINIEKYAGCDHVTCEPMDVVHFEKRQLTDYLDR
jgi:hypothetical protein